MGSILFLGGWLPVIDVYPLNVIPAPVWMIIKKFYFYFSYSHLLKLLFPDIDMTSS